MNFECGSRSFKKTPSAAESIVSHTFRRGVLFEQSLSQRRRSTSVRRPPQASLAPRQGTFMIVKRCVRERGIHALHSLCSCCRRRRSRNANDSARPTKQSIRHPRAYSNALSVCRLTACWSVRESNPRQPDYRSGALPTELTGVVDSTSPSLDSMFGTRGTDREYCVLRAAGPATSKTLLVKDADRNRTCFLLLCRQQPNRLAPASRKCSRQESDLVLDLREVACESGTPRRQ